jgi:outer membrane protein assembly factor BamA
VFSSTATNPNEPLDPEMARNGNIYNIWTLSLKTGELRQFTDTLTANVSPVVLRDQKEPRIAFVSYYKGEYGIHTLARQEPLHSVASADFGSPGPVIDFQPPLTHTLIQSNVRTKGTFEKMFLEGRPPVNLGVTSGGDLFGGTQVTFTDVLGDKQFNFFAASVSQYRTLSGSYINLSRRFQYALQAFSQTQFYYGYDPGQLFGYEYARLDRDDAVATQSARGATAYGIYPFNRYARLQVSAGLLNFRQEYNLQDLQDIANQFQEERFGRRLFSSGNFMPLGIEYIQETTVFREYGPLAGNTVRLAYEFAPSTGRLLGRQTAEVDARYYKRIASNGVLAFRARGFKSWGDFPGYMYFGGNSELRGYDYLQFLGNKAFFTNAELRFPIIEAALTPFGVVGGLRGVFFANLGAAGYEGQPMRVWTNDDVIHSPLLGVEQDPNALPGIVRPVFGQAFAIPGFKLVDGRASYGIGLETFALGFPIHFDWSWRTLFNKDYENFVFSFQGIVNGTTGSEWFRKPRFAMWIGYDF